MLDDKKVKEVIDNSFFGQDAVRSSMTVGEHTLQTIDWDGAQYDVDGNVGKWYPCYFTDGCVMSLGKLVRAKGLTWSSHKVSDRIKALDAACGKLKLNLTETKERTVTPRGGNPYETTDYYFATKRIG